MHLSERNPKGALSWHRLLVPASECQKCAVKCDCTTFEAREVGTLDPSKAPIWSQHRGSERWAGQGGQRERQKEGVGKMGRVGPWADQPRRGDRARIQNLGLILTPGSGLVCPSLSNFGWGLSQGKRKYPRCDFQLPPYLFQRRLG